MKKEPKILLVDDDLEDRFIITETFEDLGLGSVLHFQENGEEAIAFLEESFEKSQMPCLVVLDLNMPRMNGTETLRFLKHDERFRDIPVVIYSTSLNTIEKEECLALGAVSYIIKPVTFDQSRKIAQGFYDMCRSFYTE